MSATKEKLRGGGAARSGVGRQRSNFGVSNLLCIILYITSRNFMQGTIIS